MACLGRGGMACLGELSRRHRERVRHLAYRLLGQWDDADDVAQEALLRVQRAAAAYQPTARFTTWLHRIVVNLCRDVQRRRARQAQRLDAVAPPVDDDATPALEADETARRVADAVAQLAPRQRTALILHRYEGLSHQQIAEVTGDSPAAVESLLVRAYARLRRELADLQEK